MSTVTTKFTRYPSRILVENFEAYHNEESKSNLKKSLSVFEKETFRYKFCGFMYDEEKDQLLIPGGYNPDRLFAMFPDCKFIDKRNSIMNKISKQSKEYELVKSPKDIIQVKAINFLMKEKGYQKYLSLQTSQGKTYCSINYTYQKNYTPMVIVDKTALIEQWEERILQYTNLSKENIYVISGRKSIDILYHMTNEELDSIAFYLSINKTLQVLIDESPESVKNLFDYLGIGIKIYDEAHESYYLIVYLDELVDCESLYLSATPMRSNKSEQIVYRNIFYFIPMLKSKIPKNYTNVTFYSFDSKCPELDKVSFNKKRGFDVLGYCDWLFINRTKLVKDIVKDILTKLYVNKTKKKVAILLKMNSHIDILKEYLENDLLLSEPFKDLNVSVGVINGKTKNKLKEEEKDIILSTDSSFSKGIDVPNLKMLINFVPVASEARTNQIFGRLRYIEGEQVYLVDVVDTSVESVVGMCDIRLSTFYNAHAKKIRKLKGVSYNE